MPLPENMQAVTILDLAEHRLGRCHINGLTGAELESVDLAMMGGCEHCGASIAAYNAFPSRSGYWRCGSCIGPDGFATVEQAQAFINDEGITT